MSEANLPTILVQPIGYDDAQKIMKYIYINYIYTYIYIYYIEILPVSLYEVHITLNKARRIFIYMF